MPAKDKAVSAGLRHLGNVQGKLFWGPEESEFRKGFKLISVKEGIVCSEA